MIFQWQKTCNYCRIGLQNHQREGICSKQSSVCAWGRGLGRGFHRESYSVEPAKYEYCYFVEIKKFQLTVYSSGIFDYITRLLYIWMVDHCGKGLTCFFNDNIFMGRVEGAGKPHMAFLRKQHWTWRVLEIPSVWEELGPVSIFWTHGKHWAILPQSGKVLSPTVIYEGIQVQRSS